LHARRAPVEIEAFQPSGILTLPTIAATNIQSSRFTLEAAYAVHFLRGAFDDYAWLPDEMVPARIAVVIDENVAVAHPGLFDRIRRWAARHAPALQLIDIRTIAGGEAAKAGWPVIEDLGGWIRDHKLCRHSYLIAIGGGAVLDAVGFVAATAHRGLRLVRMPTTVLSMNDSGVGVKNGINGFGTKNFWGAFKVPDLVVCDYDFLPTLDQRTWVSGLAEAFKVGIIKDRDFLDWLCDHVCELRNREAEAEAHMIERTAQLHMAHICAGGDPFEQGTSRPLDFGHWSAHRLECLTDFSLLHGEAVAIGVALDLRYAARVRLIEKADCDRVVGALRAVGLPTTHTLLQTDFQAVWQGLDEFREHLGGELSIALPNPLGSVTNLNALDRSLVEQLAAEQP
jgi:3-dehydroquinate synthase